MSWRPVGLSRDLPPARVMPAQVDGQAVVVWRTNSGRIAAWDNRCPHRGMALSHGFVRGEDLACLYHGWHFNCEAGSCSLIPSHPELTPPETIKTRAFAVREVSGVIWVALDPSEAFDGVVSNEVANPQPLRSLQIDASEAEIQRVTTHLAFAPAQLWLLFNPVTPQQTLTTVLIDGSAGSVVMKQASQWCEAVRREAEG